MTSRVSGCTFFAGKQKCFLERQHFFQALNGPKDMTKLGKKARRNEASSAGFRWLTYQQIWEHLSAGFRQNLDRADRQIQAEVVGFCRRFQKIGQKTLPVAAVRLGINLSDHDRIFADLETNLADEPQKFLTLRLRSLSFPDLKRAIQRVVRGFLKRLDEGVDLDAPTDSDSDSEDSEAAPRSKLLTFRDLSRWYLKNHRKKHRPTLILILEDFEGFSAPILNDFLQICHLHISEVPLICLLGISTTEIRIYDTLSHQTISKLDLKCFAFPDPKSYLQPLFRELFIDNFDLPFRLDHSFLKFILDRFQNENFSLSEMDKALHLAVLEWTLDCPASVLCCPLKDPTLGSRLRLFVEENDVSMCFPSLADKIQGMDKREIVEFLRDKLEDLGDDRLNFAQWLRCLKVWDGDSGLPGLDQLLQVLQDGFLNSEEFNDVLDIIRRGNERELLENLAQCQQVWGAPGDPFRYFIDRLEKVEAERKKQMGEKENQSVTSAKNHRPTTRSSGGVKHHEWQASVKKMLEDRAKNDPFEAFRRDLTSWLRKEWRKALSPPTEHPLRPVFLAVQNADFKDKLCLDIRKHFQLALSTPDPILGCGRHVPDPTVAFRVYKVALKKSIPLHLWFEAFRDALQTHQPPPKKKKRKEEQELLLQARFGRVLGELEWTGCIKWTKKDGMVQRVFGVDVELWDDEDEGLLDEMDSSIEF